MTTLGAVASNTSLVRELRIPQTQFRKGATAPTDETVGTTPTVPALRFDAVAELATVVVHMPDDWDGGGVDMRLLWRLVNAQTNGQTLDVTCDYVAATLATGAGFGKASSQITGQVTAVTGRLAAGDLYEMILTFAAGDATNPLSKAVQAIAAEIHLTNVTGVAAAHLMAGKMRYTATR